MLERLPRNRRNAALGFLALLLIWFCWSIRAVINPLLMGYLLAYILHPLVLRVQARGIMTRGKAVTLIFVLGGGLIFAIGLGLVVQTQNLLRQVVENEEVHDKLQGNLTQLWTSAEEVLPEGFLPEAPEIGALREWARNWSREDLDRERAAAAGWRVAGGAWNFFLGFFGSLFGIASLVFLVPLYTYYLLFELERLHHFVQGYLPRTERARIGRVSEQIGEVLASFFRGRLLVCLLKGGLTTAGLAVAGVDYAFLLGMSSGFLSLIPAFGPLIGFLAALTLGVLEHGPLGSLLRVGIVFGAAELIEGYFLIPKVLGDSLGLHPVVVLFSLLAGGAALGLFGVLVALPLTASLVILARELVLPALKNFAEEESPLPEGVPVASSDEAQEQGDKPSSDA